jgi:GGDEF domain-containing protein
MLGLSVYKMISIRKNVDELERCSQTRDLALDCYISALRNAAHYAIELDPQLTTPYRQYLGNLASEVAAGQPEAMTESRATLRGLMRDYRDKASEFLGKLQGELAGTARALQEILETMTQGDGNHEVQLRGALARLRSIANSTEGSAVRETIAAATGSIEDSLEQIRKQHQVTVSQFLTEIRMLHKRIDVLEAASAIDELTKLFNHSELEDRIRTSGSTAYCLLLVRVAGLRAAAVNFSPAVSAELTGAFIKRLRNSLPENAVIGRWAEEDFVVILSAPKTEVMNSGKFIAEHLGGSYACIQNGKTVRPSLQLRIGVVESQGDKPERVLGRVMEFLPVK